MNSRSRSSKEQQQGPTARGKIAPTGESSLLSRLPMYDRGLLRKAISYLFTNIPENWSPKRLWYLFATYGAGLGRIVDVFIPKKKDRKGNRFGFVRYSDVKDKSKLEKMLKMICFGTEKIRVTIATDREPKQAKQRPPHTFPPPPPPETFKSRSFAEALLNGLNPPNYSIQPNKFTSKIKAQPEELKTGKNAGNSILELEEDFVDSSWLANCATGEVYCPNLIPGLQQELWENGFTTLKITPMGGCKVLIQSEEKSQTTNFIENEKAQWSKWFGRVKLWGHLTSPEQRLAWIRITGLPLHAWNQKALGKIGNFLGSFIKVDEFTLNKECLDAARILITTSDANQINGAIQIKIQNHLHSVNISEERWRTDPWWLKAAKIYDSDESDSENPSDEDSDQNFGSWCFNSDEEVDKPQDFEKEPLAAKMLSHPDIASPKMKIALETATADLGRTGKKQYRRLCDRKWLQHLPPVQLKPLIPHRF
ncbi:hypothetical protein SLA2020_332580 [Shorea laevis]